MCKALDGGLQKKGTNEKEPTERDHNKTKTDKNHVSFIRLS